MSPIIFALSFNEEIILRIVDLLAILFGTLIAAGLAYKFGIKKLIKSRELSIEESRLSRRENELSRKILLYKDLIKELMDAVSLDPNDKEQKKEKENKLNRLGMELLQFAPDQVYKEYLKIFSKWKKGQPITDVLEFIITLRKELIPDTKLTIEDIYTIEFP